MRVQNFLSKHGLAAHAELLDRQGHIHLLTSLHMPQPLEGLATPGHRDSWPSHPYPYPYP